TMYCAPYAPKVGSTERGALQQSPPSAAPAVQHPPPARRPCRRLALLAARRLPPAWWAAAAGRVASRARPALVCGAAGGSAVRGAAGAGVTCKVAFFFLSARRGPR